MTGLKLAVQWQAAADVANSVTLSVAWEEGGRLMFHSMHTTVEEAVSMGERWLIQTQTDYPWASVSISARLKNGWLKR